MSDTKSSPVQFLPLGAIIQSIVVGGHNVVLGFESQDDYTSIDHPYFGETIGRIPNRLSDGLICGLNGRDYTMSKNERGITTLHGGPNGWGKKLWQGPEIFVDGPKLVNLFTLRSPDGDEGFPGELEARVKYIVEKRVSSYDGCTRGTEEVILDIEYEVEMIGKEGDITETVCAMTNHSYWNLSGGSTVSGTAVTLFSDQYLEVDSNQIPTGRVLEYPGIKAYTTVEYSDKGPVIDDCFILDANVNSIPLDTRSRPLRRYASLYHPVTKLHLEAETTEPSFQFYTGDGINVVQGIDANCSGIKRYGPRSGMALEPNRYINAANRSEWRHLVLLKKGERWGCRNRFTVWLE